MVVVVDGDTEIVGSGFTVTVVAAVFWHPLMSVPVTVYIVVAVGEAKTDAPVPTDRPPVGVQLYVLAPVAVSGVLEPIQMAMAEAGEIATVGSGFTVIVLVPVFTHPFTSVPVTV
jgi:ABC-type sugar transport system substrate-binding protein